MAGPDCLFAVGSAASPLCRAAASLGDGGCFALVGESTALVGQRERRFRYRGSSLFLSDEGAACSRRRGSLRKKGLDWKAARFVVASWPRVCISPGAKAPPTSPAVAERPRPALTHHPSWVRMVRRNAARRLKSPPGPGPLPRGVRVCRRHRPTTPPVAGSVRPVA
jgi:hypothetical protein